jgi:hypothetical protein
VMKLRYIIFFAPLFLVTTAARAEISANKMFQHFDGGDKRIKEFYLTALQSNFNGLQWANAYLATQNAAQIFCSPKGGTFSGEKYWKCCVLA